MPKTNITLEECHQLFRERGVSISKDALGQFIIEGKVPFGSAVFLKHIVYLIFRDKTIKYLDEMCGGCCNENTQKS